MTLGRASHQKPGQPGRIADDSGEARGVAGRDEARVAGRGREGLGRGDLLTQVLSRENMGEAWKRVKSNKGSAGVDGLTIEQTVEHLKTQWPRIRQEIREGVYRPQAVRRVEIPKPTGGVRELGIPTVTDRLIQQALLQVLQPLIDPTFSEFSYGFRPGRSAHDAVLQAQRYAQDGYRVVVDVDLEKFFDRVNHDILMDRLRRRVDDPAVLRLVRAYLDSGIMVDGVAQQRYQGTPQGGPLSPLLANVLLDEVDRELERRGHCFVRYADDCNVYVRSRRAGERVMALLRRLYGKLKLTVNESKSAVGSAFGRKFLGYDFWQRKGVVRRGIATKAMATFKQRVRELTRRSGGRSMAQVVERLRTYLLGWKAYFRLAQTPGVLRKRDEWLRHRLRAIQLRQWKRGATIHRELRRLGANEATARRVAANSRCWWRNSAMLLNAVLDLAYFDALGLPRLS